MHYLKGYTAFNAEQIDGLPAHFYITSSRPRETAFARVARAEQFFAATAAHIAHGGDRAYYRPSTDCIAMPTFEAFRDGESYYATLAHEIIHWTSHASRLDRHFGSGHFASESYAMEVGYEC